MQVKIGRQLRCACGHAGQQFAADRRSGPPVVASPAETFPQAAQGETSAAAAAVRWRQPERLVQPPAASALMRSTSLPVIAPSSTSRSA